MNKFWITDASICFTGENSTLHFAKLMSKLKKCGYTVTLDPRIVKSFPSLSSTHRYLTKMTPAGLFECCADYYPTGMKLECFQNVTFDNPNGGRYDFSRLSKMPFLIRMQHLHFLSIFKEYMRKIESAEVPSKDYNASPLEQFNHGWTEDRFRRGPDGWPDESELKSWASCNITADKVKITQGMLAYGICDSTRRLVCGTAAYRTTVAVVFMLRCRQPTEAGRSHQRNRRKQSNALFQKP